jgi:hypothetical protein
MSPSSRRIRLTICSIAGATLLGGAGAAVAATPAHDNHTPTHALQVVRGKDAKLALAEQTIGALKKQLIADAHQIAAVQRVAMREAQELQQLKQAKERADAQAQAAEARAKAAELQRDRAFAALEALRAKRAAQPQVIVVHSKSTGFDKKFDKSGFDPGRHCDGHGQFGDHQHWNGNDHQNWNQDQSWDRDSSQHWDHH